MISRAVVLVIILKVQTRKAQGQERAKVKDTGKNRDSRGGAPGQSSNAPTIQARTRRHKPMSPSVRPCLKCGSRNHEYGKCPRNQEHRKLHGTCHEFHSVVFGFRRVEQ